MSYPRLTHIICIISLVVLLFVPTLGAQAAAAMNLYVSTQGRDEWSGRLAAPNARRTDGPFATPARARDAIRTLKQAGGLTLPVVVQLRSGTYYLPETLTFTAQDSGTATCPISYAAYRGETPVLSGGTRLAGWKTDTINGHPCWTTTLPEVAAGSWYFKELFVNGVRRPRTRLPKTGFYRFTGTPKGTEQNEWFHGPNSASFAPDELRPWRNLADVELIAPQLWFESHHHIRGIDETAHTVTFYANSLGNLKDEIDSQQGTRYFVENVSEALDTPGQWYLDRPTGTLYYLPLPGENPATSEVIAPRLACLLQLTGANDKPKVQYLHFENLAFRHAEWNLKPEDPGSIQAATAVPGAILLAKADDNAFYGCTVTQAGTYAIELLDACARNRIIACDFFDLGAGGVKVGHRSERTTISDCRIHDGGLIYPSAVGVWVGDSGYNRIRHNDIYNLYYTGISCGWTWGYAPTRTIDNRIEYNHIHDLGRGLLSDMGGIYTLGTQPGTVLRGNRIHDITRYGYGGWGIYPDEGNSEMLIEDNLIYRTMSAGFHQHYGRDNLVRNNMFLLSFEAQLQRSRMESHRSFVLTGNIICEKDGALLNGSWNDGHFLLSNNLYWNTGRAEKYPFNGHNLPEWQAWGQDAGSVIADPAFRNPRTDDFRLGNNSPARKLGFRPFDPANAGARFRDKKPATLTQWPAEHDAPAVIVRSSLEMVEPITFTPGARPGSVQLTVKNAGETRATGTITMSLVPADAGQLTGEPTVTFALDPGQQQVARFAITGNPAAQRLAIQTTPGGDAVIPTCLYVDNASLRTWEIPRLAPLTTLDEVPAALAAAPPRAVYWTGITRAEARIGVAGNQLAFHAKVVDAHLLRNANFWEGSCIQIYASTPGTTRVRQIAFLPPTPTAPADVLLYQSGEKQPTPPAQWRIHPVESGYEIDALIPLQVLLLEENVSQFLLEMSVSSTPSADRAHAFTTLFGSTSSYNDNSHFATILVKNIERK